MHREAFDFGLGGGEADHRDDDGCTGEKPGLSAGDDVEVKKAVAMSISLDWYEGNLVTDKSNGMAAQMMGDGQQTARW